MDLAQFIVESDDFQTLKNRINSAFKVEAEEKALVGKIARAMEEPKKEVKKKK